MIDDAVASKLWRLIDRELAEYDITLEASEKPVGFGWVRGPSLCTAIHISRRVIWADEYHARTLDMAMWVQHEIEHVVFFHPDAGLDTDEAIMMPWSVAGMRTVGLGVKDYFWHQFTADTAIAWGDGYVDVGDWRRPWATAWYKWAVRQCRALGVVDDTGRPTWRLPEWGALPKNHA